MLAETLDIKDLRQWLVWRSEERDGKMTKIPYSPSTGQRASSTAPETWSGYEEALRACREQGYSGIGFVFTAEDGLCGVDLDGCLDPETGEIEQRAKSVFQNRFAGNRHGNGEPQIVLSVGRVARVTSTTRGAPDRF